jgi:hypothetical protein
MVFTVLCVKFMEGVQWIAAIHHGGHLVYVKVRQVSKVIQNKKTLWPGCKPLFAFYPNVSISFPLAVMELVTLAHPVKHFLEVPHCRSVSFTPACHLVFIKDYF